MAINVMILVTPEAAANTELQLKKPLANPKARLLTKSLSSAVA
jgi:hypothetical protein